MKNWLRNLDLYKAIIFGSLLLLPAVGGWAWWLRKQIDTGRLALAAAIRSSGESGEGGGDLEEIGRLQKSLQEQTRDRDADSGQDFSTYFQRCITKGAGAIQRADFHVDRREDIRVQNKAIDTLVAISFKRQGKDFPLPRDALLAILFNCESQSAIWKLRSLRVTNPGVKRSQGGNKVPPPELADEWQVSEMVFASRRPIGADRK